VLALDRLEQPAAQRLSSGRCDSVDALFRPAVLSQGLFDDQPALFQAGQRGIDLGGLDVPVFFATDHSLERVVQLVAVARALF
jgi:hypothetical protein